MFQFVCVFWSPYSDVIFIAFVPIMLLLLLIVLVRWLQKEGRSSNLQVRVRMGVRLCLYVSAVYAYMDVCPQ
jgi:hypothetical protein